MQAWQRSTTVSVNISLSIFADDTTVIGNRKELETGVRRMTEKMERFEQRTHPQKGRKTCVIRKPTARRSACWDAGWDQMRTSNKESEDPEACGLE